MSKKKNAKVFRKSVKKYSKFFNLQNWEIGVTENPDKSSRLLAQCCTWTIESFPDGNGKVCTIYYSRDWIKKKLHKKEIRQTAFHEVCELLLSTLRDYSSQHKYFISPREVDNEVHSIIRILENKIFPIISTQ